MKAFLLVALLSACRRPSACEKAGGHVVEVNCRQVLGTLYFPDGDGNLQPQDDYTRECDRVCVMERDGGR